MTAQNKLPRGIRNNNPGNIRRGNDEWKGASSWQTDKDFVTFDAPEFGIRALAKILLNYQFKHHRNTVREIIARWAPPKENDTLAYIVSVSRETGFSEDTPLNLSRYEYLMPLVVAIIRHENGQQPYTMDAIDKGILLAGISPPSRAKSTQPPGSKPGFLWRKSNGRK